MTIDFAERAANIFICFSVIFGGLLLVSFLVWALLKMWEAATVMLYRHCEAWRDLNKAANQLRREREKR